MAEILVRQSYHLGPLDRSLEACGRPDADAWGPGRACALRRQG